MFMKRAYLYFLTLIAWLIPALLHAADINGITVMAYTASKPYSGTFDGQGHTLTINYETRDEDYTAPFRYTKEATIKDLTVEGKITTSTKSCCKTIRPRILR